MGLSRKKLVYISFFSLLQIILIGTSSYFLYTSPSVGITVEWDKALQCWKVESTEAWSALKEGDLIKSIGGVEIGYPHLQQNLYELDSRKEVLAWFQARKELYRKLSEKNVNFKIIRELGELTINLQPGKAGWSFLSSRNIFYLLHVLSFLIVGLAVVCKKGENKEHFILYFMCSWSVVAFITLFTIFTRKLSVEPHFESLMFLVNAASRMPFVSMYIMHMALLVPKKSVILERVPWLPLIWYPAGVLMISSLNPGLFLKVYGLWFVLVAAIAAHDFLHCSNSVERGMCKWAAAGFFSGLLPVMILSVIPLKLTGNCLVRPEIAASTLVLAPICIAFAINRYRLMGIDDLFEGALVYAATIALLVIIDIFLMSVLSSEFGRQLELRPTGRIVLSLAVTISIYAAVRERLRLYIKKLFGRAPGEERDVIAAFTRAASGEPPDSIAKVLQDSIRNGFKPKALKLISREEEERGVSAFNGKSEPVILWESPLKDIQPQEEMLLALPLGRGDEADYVLFLGELPTGEIYGSYEIGILRSLLVHARLLYENAWLYDENLRYCRTIIEEGKKHLVEKEKILRDLHDGIGGIMTNIGLLSAVAQKSASAADSQKPLSTISELSREGLTEIRTIMHSLDGESLTWEGLAADFRGLGAKMIEPNGMAFQMEISLCDQRQRPGSLLYLNLLRIYKECLNNIVKHSEAHRVQVRFETGIEKIALCVQDDGVGIGESGPKQGRGLPHMRARAEDIGGALSVSSGRGTIVKLEVP